jgi:hypothetical protein
MPLPNPSPKGGGAYPAEPLSIGFTYLFAETATGTPLERHRKALSPLVGRVGRGNPPPAATQGSQKKPSALLL